MRGSGDWVLFLRWFENCTRDIFHGILISFFNFHEEEETRKLCSHVATCCQGVPAAAQYRAQQRDVARSSISVSQLTFYVTSDTNFTTFAMCFMLLLHVAPLPVVGCHVASASAFCCGPPSGQSNIFIAAAPSQSCGNSPPSLPPSSLAVLFARIGVPQMHVPRLYAQFCLG